MKLLTCKRNTYEKFKELCIDKMFNIFIFFDYIFDDVFNIIFDVLINKNNINVTRNDDISI